MKEILRRRWAESESLLFASPKTGLVATQTKTAIINACRRAGIERLTIKDLRRTYGTRLHEMGWDDATVGQLLGHTDGRSVHRYKRGKMIKRQAVDSLVPTTNPAKSLPPSVLFLKSKG